MFAFNYEHSSNLRLDVAVLVNSENTSFNILGVVHPGDGSACGISLCMPFTSGVRPRPPWPILSVLRFWFVATTLLYVWSAVCVRDEPRLVRIARLSRAEFYFCCSPSASLMMDGFTIQ